MPVSDKREPGSSDLGRASTSCWMSPRYSLRPLWRSSRTEAAKSVWAIHGAKALPIFQQLRGGWLWVAVYGTCPGSQASRAPQRLTQPRIFIGLSQERLVAVAQSGKPNFCWLLSVWWADSREAWRRVVRGLAGLAPW